MNRVRLAFCRLFVCGLSVVTAAASPDAVRFTASPGVVQMRVEVLLPSGTALYDSDWKGGNVLDWAMPILPYGSYRVRIHSRDLEGGVAEKETTLQVAADQITLDPVTGNDVKLTTTAHDGTVGQLITTSGDLSFRFGNYLNREDAEAMRLTSEGNLDVAGVIRAGKGIRFPDGTIQQTAGIPSVVRLPGTAGYQPVAAVNGTGTVNKLTKWTDTAGTLGDSAITEAGNKVTVGTTTAFGQVNILGPAVSDVFSGMGPNIVSGPAMNYGYSGNTFGRGSGFFNVRPDASAVAPNPSLRFLTVNQQRMIITNVGDVGIGTSIPLARLDVTGTQPAGGGGVGATASDVMRVVGGRGEDSFVGGNGGGVLIQSGAGGAGFTQGGNGGSITLQPGALGVGGLNGQAGNVLMAGAGGNVGIGTIAPSQKLDVMGNVNAGGNLTVSGRIDQTSIDGLVARGTLGSGSISDAGAGTRLMWYPGKAAFRAGGVDGTQWDDVSVGNYSTAIGLNTIASGVASTAMGSATTASGPYCTAMGANTTASGDTSTAMGSGSMASGLAATAMGFTAVASGFAATAMGTYTTASGDYSTAMGYEASTTGGGIARAGAFVYGDTSTTTPVTPSVANQFVVRAAGGTIFFSNAAMTTGVSLAANGTSWSSVSDRNRKEDFRPVNGEQILARLAALPVTSWRYKNDSSGNRYIGPMAQDFHAQFGLGNDTTISTLDVDGVTLAGIKALERRTADFRTETKALEAENAALRDQLERLVRRVEQLEGKRTASQ